MEVVKIEDKEIAVLKSGEIIMKDVNSALDIIMSISYHTGYSKMIINKSAVVEEFFDLKTKLAGEILQKFINYGTKVAIVGDFSMYKSKSLNDFIYECNIGSNIFFVPTDQEAVIKLSTA